MHSITTLDNLWMGRPRSIAASLLESDGYLAIVDPGPGSTLETLRQQLQARGVGVGDLDAILLTHIHLDHGRCHRLARPRKSRACRLRAEEWRSAPD